MLGDRRKNECEKIREMFSSYLDERLDPVNENKVRFHVKRCEDCRRELESLEATRQLLRHTQEEDVPRHFAVPEVWRGWNPEPWGVRSINVLRIATAIATVLLIVVLSCDFTGAFQNPASEETITIKQGQPESSALPGEEPSGPSIESPRGEEGSETSAAETSRKEAEPPEESPPPEYKGIAGRPDGTDKTARSAEDTHNLQEAREAVPTQPSPWLRPVEIGIGTLVVVLGGLTVWAWGGSRRLSIKKRT